MSSSAAPILSARNLGKSFAGRTVLRGVDLDILPGEIHGLVGQNGSGKSTLIKILSGYNAPDPGGSLVAQGENVRLPLGQGDATRLGFAFVHQDLGLFDSASVVENLRVGRYKSGIGWFVSWKRERTEALRSLHRFGVDIDPRTTVSTLSDVQRALVAIVRALDQLRDNRTGLLVLDEPTAYLPKDSADALFEATRRVAAEGFGVIFVSHRLSEVFRLCDRVTVLRNGELVQTTETCMLRERDLIAMIVGFPLEELYPEVRAGDEEAFLSVRDLTSESLHGVSFDVSRGQIIGLTGLLGMGQDDVPYLLFGAKSAMSGTLSIADRTYDLTRFDPQRAMRAGLALLPGSRLRDGGTPTASAAENLTLATLGRYFRRGFLRRHPEDESAADWMRRFAVTPMETDRPLLTFSGGNQQKILVAKWFATDPRVLLLHEPVHGVDVGAKRDIFRHISDAASRGTSLVIASVEYEDLANLCDRVLVFRDGLIATDLRGAELTPERILEQCLATPAATAISDDGIGS